MARLTILMVICYYLLPCLTVIQPTTEWYYCDHTITYMKKDAPISKICWTGVSPLEEHRTKSPIVPFNNDPVLNDGNVLCFASTIKVYTLEPAVGSDSRRGCNVRYDRIGEEEEMSQSIVVWTAVIEAHSQCAFMCIGYSSGQCDWQGGHHCLTYRTMTDTVNSLDAVRVHDRFSGNKDQYETFCGLSGYNMTLIASQPGGTGITNGYCQLYADSDSWMGAAWKLMPAKPTDQDYSSSCEVNCYDVNKKPGRGVLTSHSIHRDTFLTAPSATGYYQCGLAYLNIQPSVSGKPYGCQLSIEKGQWWTITVYSPEDGPRGSVECGVVCSCDSGIGGSYDCVVPRYENLEKPVTTVLPPGPPDSSYVYPANSMSMASVIVVTVISFAVLVWIFRFRRNPAARCRPKHDM